MNDRFHDFKKKLILETLLKSLFIGLSVGFVCIGTPIIVLLILNQNLGYWYYIVGGGFLVAAIITLTLFFIKKPNDVKVAKRIDNDLNLHEKVQTMIIYQNDNGVIAEVQRENTKEILNSIPKKNLKLKIGTLLIVLFAMSAGLFASSQTYLFVRGPVNAVKPPEEEKEPTYNLDPWTLNALRDLIEHINNSEAVDDCKTGLVSSIETLINDLNVEEITVNEMTTFVKAAIERNNKVLDKINTTVKISTVLWESESPAIVKIATAIYRYDYAYAQEAVDLIKEELDVTTYKSAGQDLHKNFGLILKENGYDIESDGLIKILYTASNQINSLTTSATASASKEIFLSRVEQGPIKTLKSELPKYIMPEANNYQEKTYVNDKLIELFSIKADEAPKDEYDRIEHVEEEQPNQNDQEDHSGGLGTGELILGSDDVMLDYEKGYVQYKDVINQYFGDIFSQFEDGEIPEEYKDYFDHYFDILFGSIKDEENEGNGE